MSTVADQIAETLAAAGNGQTPHYSSLQDGQL
jgi:hypothetical protein